MRKKLYIAAIICISVFGLLGCFREIDPNNVGGGHDKPPKPDLSVVGEWNWIKSVGGLGGWTRTPVTENKTMKLVLTTKGDYTLYVNGQIESDLRYVLKRDTSRLYNKVADMLITYDKSPNKPGDEINRYVYTLSPSKDTLTLAEECADCFTHTYVRIK